METNVIRNGDGITIAVSGRIDSDTAPELAGVIEGVVNEARSLVLDFKKLDYISVSGLRLLLSVMQVVHYYGGSFSIINAGDYFYQIWNMTRMIEPGNFVRGSDCAEKIELVRRRLNNGVWDRDAVRWVLGRKSVYDDESFDILLKLCMEHSTGLASLNNARDLGGYRTEDGRTVARHKIIRSAALSKMTEEDADRLYDMGINTIIDFRGAGGRTRLPDINTEKFRCIPCEMAQFVKTENQRKLADMASESGSSDPERELWLNGEFLREFDVEELYRENFTSGKSIAGIRQMLDIMLDDETTGVLIHCKDGKDRTGVAALIILILLGVNEYEYVCDYMASAVSTFAMTELTSDFFEFYSYDDDIVANSRREKSVDYNLAVAISDWMIEKYGANGAYFRDELKLDEDYVNRLRDKFLE